MKKLFFLSLFLTALYAFKIEDNNHNSNTVSFCPRPTSPISVLSDSTHYVKDWTDATYSKKSFHFDGTAKYFSGDATASSIVNNAIVGSNKKFTIVIAVKRLATGVTQMLFERENSTTNVRQFNVFFSSANKFVTTFYTSSGAYIQYQSTGTYTDSREWHEFEINYDGTQSVLNRITVRDNGQSCPGTTTKTGTPTTINNTSANPIQIGGRQNAGNYSTSYINHVALFNTNLSSSKIALTFNGRIPFDLRSNTSLDSSLVMYLSADSSSSFSTNWTWNDIKGSAVFTSTGMVQADLYNDAPALKQVSVLFMNGQSNITGRVNMDSLPSIFTGDLSWVKYWGGSNFTDANSSLNNNQYIEHTNQFGSEYFISDSLNKALRKTIYVFKVAEGGTYLNYVIGTDDWATPNSGQPGGGEMWIKLRSNIDSLKNWELNNNYTITHIGIIWGQGEADSKTLSYANNYQANWHNWLTAAGTSSIINGKIIPKFYIQPFVIDWLLSRNQINSSYLYKPTINTGKINEAATNPSFYFTVNTDSATVNNVDSAHYTFKGYKTVSDSTVKRILQIGF